MIRFSTTHDIPSLKALWKQCFDDGDFSETFFRLLWAPERCLLWEEDGRIASMLYLLPATVQCNGEHYALFYIYGCATDPEYRRRGFMNRLLDQSYRLASERGIAALTLVPASNRLKRYYAGCGFQPGSTLRKGEFDRNIPAPSPIRPNVFPLSAARLQQLRSLLLPNERLVEWPLSHLSAEMDEDEAPQSGGRWREDSDSVSYVVYSTLNRVLIVKEFATNTPDRWNEQLHRLVDTLEFDRMEVITHPSIPLGEECEGGAMIRPTACWPCDCPPKRLFFNLCLSE